MAHVGEKVRLGARGRFGNLLGAAHFLLGPFALGDVLDVGDHHLPVLILGEKDRHLDVDGPSVLGEVPAFPGKHALSGAVHSIIPASLSGHRRLG